MTTRPQRKTERTALLVGATGLVGAEVLLRLLDRPLYRRVRVVGRRPCGVEHPELEERLVDFSRLADIADAFVADDVFCSLGTTLAAAGSQEAFRRVDRDLVVEVARRAREAGARRFLLVSAVGADPTSSVFYNRVKGETEEAVAALGYPELHVFRPSLLLGEREESRPLERVGVVLGRVLGGALAGPLRPLRPVPASVVAEAMVRAASAPGEGRSVHGYEEIRRLAGGGGPPAAPGKVGSHRGWRRT